jgi:hypothetical protein
LYTSYLVWNPSGVGEALMRRLQSHFSEEQIVELGYFVSLTFGQQRWIKTLDIGHGEVSVATVAAAGAARAGLVSEDASP